MIINTVIVFLRDLLPIFILFSYLTVLFEHKVLNISFWIKSMILSILLTAILFTFAEFIANWFEGAGLEIINTLLLVITYSAFVLLNILPSNKNTSSMRFHILAFLGIASFIAFKGIEFLVFFSVHAHQEEKLYGIIIGCILGIGICISFSTLFRFLLRELRESRYPFIFLFIWYCFLAGQFSQITLFLSQVDLLSLGYPVINISNLVKDSSEYGHILNALIGYESSPTLGFIMTYLLALITPLLITFIISKRDYFAFNKESNHE